MRRLILSITAFAFCWGQTAGAFPQNEIPDVKNFIQKSGLSQKPVKLKDLYEANKEKLPLNFRFEIERVLEAHPNAMLPKFEVRMIKNGNHEDIQLIAQQGKQSAVVTLMNRNKVYAEMTHTYKGKDLKTTMGYADMMNPVQMISNLYGPGVLDPVAGDNFARLLRYNELALLKPEDRQQYTAQVRELLVTTEKAQNVIEESSRGPANKKPAPKKSPAKKTSALHPLLMPLFLADEAHAAMNSGSCLTMGGWIGQYEGGECKPPADAWDDKQKCNVCFTGFHGAKATCSSKAPKGSGLTTSGICNSRNENKAYDVFTGVKNQAEFDQRQNQISLHINEIDTLCREAQNHNKAECKDLAKKMADLRAVNCNTLKTGKFKDTFVDLSCAKPAGTRSGPVRNAQVQPRVQSQAAGGLDGNEGEGREPAPEGATNADGMAGELGPAGENENPSRARATAARDVSCDGLPQDKSSLSCGTGSVGTAKCNGQIAYYCICASASEERSDNAARATACVVREKPVSSSVDENGRYKRRYGATVVKEEKSWWSSAWDSGAIPGFLGLAAIVGLGIYMFSNSNTTNSIWSNTPVYTPDPIKLAPAPLTTAPPNTVTNPSVITVPGTR